jgi:hypothetical protein
MVSSTITPKSSLSAGTIVTFQGLVGASALNGFSGCIVQASPALNPSNDEPIPIIDESKVEVFISNETMKATGRKSAYLILSIEKVKQGAPVGLLIRHLSIDPEDLGIVESFYAENGTVSIKMSHDASIRSDIDLRDILPAGIFDPIWQEFETVRHEFLECGKQLYFGGKPDAAAIV